MTASTKLANATLAGVTNMECLETQANNLRGKNALNHKIDELVHKERHKNREIGEQVLELQGGTIRYRGASQISHGVIT